jgi:hypothetical protein
MKHNCVRMDINIAACMITRFWRNVMTFAFSAKEKGLMDHYGKIRYSTHENVRRRSHTANMVEIHDAILEI